MKKIIYSLFVCLIFAFSSCEDDSTKDTSKVTYFVDLEIFGDAAMVWPKGTPFVEPGFHAVLDGEDVTSDVVVTGSVDVSNAGGIYTLKYAAVNADNFAKELYRTVYIYDTTDSPLESGIYWSATDSYRDDSGTITVYGGSYQVSVVQIEPGLFEVSDFLGGYYEYRAGYGSAYAAKGRFRVKADNTLEFISGHVDGWDEDVAGLIAPIFDPETSTISWGTKYSTFIFYVTLTK